MTKMKLVDERNEGRNYPTTRSFEDKINSRGRVDEELAQQMLNALKQRDAHVARLIIHIETRDRECCDLDERYLEVIESQGSAHKLTVNPVDGRITLKVSKKASAAVTSELIEMAEQLKTMELPAMTLRGKITWHKHLGYQCQLVSGSKRIKKSINYQPLSLKQVEQGAKLGEMKICGGARGVGMRTLNQ